MYLRIVCPWSPWPSPNWRPRFLHGEQTSDSSGIRCGQDKATRLRGNHRRNLITSFLCQGFCDLFTGGCPFCYSQFHSQVPFFYFLFCKAQKIATIATSWWVSLGEGNKGLSTHVVSFSWFTERLGLGKNVVLTWTGFLLKASPMSCKQIEGSSTNHWRRVFFYIVYSIQFSDPRKLGFKPKSWPFLYMIIIWDLHWACKMLLEDCDCL